MTRRRSIKGALRNFLGTLTSRYSDYDGYWVSGLIVGDLREATIDLLAESKLGMEAAPMTALIRLARERFHEQLGNQRIPTSFIRCASLKITRSHAPSEGHVNGHVVGGYEVTFSTRVLSDLHTVYASAISVFVAPHNADLETRSIRREGKGK